MSRNSPEKPGYTLVELLVSMAILGGGLIATVGTLGTLLRVHNFGLQRAQAMTIATDLYEQYRMTLCQYQPGAFSNITNDWPDVVTDSNDMPNIPVSESVEWIMTNVSTTTLQNGGPLPRMFMVHTDPANNNNLAALALGPNGGFDPNPDDGMDVEYVIDYQIDDQVQVAAVDTKGVNLVRLLMIRVRWPKPTPPETAFLNKYILRVPILSTTCS